MIERKDLFTIPFYKKTHFSGSYQGMHYRIKRIEQDEKNILRATVFPGPYCFDVVSDEKKTAKDFDFSEDGIANACKWLNEQYAAAPDEWAKGRL